MKNATPPARPSAEVRAHIAPSLHRQLDRIAAASRRSLADVFELILSKGVYTLEKQTARQPKSPSSR
ncbi:MAG: hypothetical protein J0I10_21585 [Verrucomicrobia bacterium]|nr:hypothetical protein [Verrucomicrobiota bacterium]